MVRIRSIDEQPFRHPGDSAELDPIGRPPGGGSAKLVRDVLLVPTLTSDGDWENFPPFDGEPENLGRGLRLEVLDGAESDLVMNACASRGHYFWPMRQFGALYAFVLDVDLAVYDQHEYAWDVDGIIVRALQLSRLIQDSGHSTQFAARVVDFDTGEKQVIPHSSSFPQYLATYRMREDRDWLTREQARELGSLLDAWFRNAEQLPTRVQRAVSLCEGVVHQPVVERALVILFMAFEALVNTGKEQVTKQVALRLRALANEIGVEGVSRRFTEEMYEDRSQPAHGQELKKLLRGTPEPLGPDGKPPGPTDVALDQEAAGEIDMQYLADLARLQDLLRATVRRAIEDSEFASIFGSDDSIAKRWPIT